MAQRKRDELKRAAARGLRLVDSVEKLETKGRTKSKDYRARIKELSDLAPQIVAAREKAEAELHQIRTDGIFARRSMQEQQEALTRDRAAFEQKKAEINSKRKEEQSELKRQMAEIQRERRELSEAQAAAETAKQKYEAAMQKIQKAAAAI